jgi:two-component system, LytTR family, sensor kinase
MVRAWHPRDQRTRILLGGAAGWIMLGVVFTVGQGWRRYVGGIPFADAWYDAGHHLLIFLMGAVLSPVVIIVLGRLRSRAPSPVHIAAGYIGVGLSYWASWTLLRMIYMRTVYPVTATELGFVDHYIRSLVFSALIALTVYTAMVLIFETVWYRGETRERELEAARLQVALDEARSTALRARVDTDLLSDALARASLVMTRDVQAARTVLVSLSELLRFSLRDGAGTIPLRSEIELVRNIVDIYSSGHQNAPAVDLLIDPLLGDQGVPALVLQPALVGAFRWFRYACTQDGARITVEARRSGEHLVFSITAHCPVWSSACDDEVRLLQGRLQERYAGVAATRVRCTPDGGFEIRVRLEDASSFPPSAYSSRLEPA